MYYLKQTVKLAKEHGVEVVERPNGHLQLKGDLLVNYYPDSKNKTAYVAGTTGGKKGVLPETAIGMCFRAPELSPGQRKDARGKDSRRKRQALLKKMCHCHWCGKHIDIDTSTLEHIIPLHRGGLDNANNRTLACYDCNNGRGHDMPELESKNP
jgi:transcription elongation factor Elf1